MTREATAQASEQLVETCRLRAIALLERNLGPHGILAATAGRKAAARGYDAIFGRDAAVCALGMALSGDRRLERGALAGLLTVAAHQAPNGQMPKFVRPQRREADFWYLGCIDATLWWLIAVDFLHRRGALGDLKGRLARPIARALDWLACQEHQRFFLLMQGEASDWADIMPRSGFVLYTNALWYRVKRLYRLPHADETHDTFNRLFHPFSAGLTDYRRARLLIDYVKRKARNRDLYLSFVNFSFFGEEGDVLGNLLAILMGLADARASRRVLCALREARVDRPYPVRAVCDPIGQRDPLWRDYMNRHRQNLAWQYHNGGVWPFVGGFWVCALAQAGEPALARAGLHSLARANALGGWAFNEWLHGRSLRPRGMRGQSWNAAAYLLAYSAVAKSTTSPGSNSGFGS
ncbi:MAG TPA: glycoside hydrolase 100 family protein [Burkholderiales bacterium]|nr:glycoside hydrolase 100 family protein [Burkholderiales bacterium]